MCPARMVATEEFNVLADIQFSSREIIAGQSQISLEDFNPTDARHVNVDVFF